MRNIWFFLLSTFILSLNAANAASSDLDPSTSIRFEQRNIVEPGGVMYIGFILENPNVEYSAFQCNLDYPNGWKAMKFSQQDACIGTKTYKSYCQIISGGRLDVAAESSPFLVSLNVVGDDDWYIFGFVDWDEGKRVVCGNDAIAVLAIQVPTEANPGNYTINVSNIALGTGLPNGEGYGSIDDFSFTVTVKNTKQSATNISLNKLALSMYAETSETLLATVQPYNAAQCVFWQSSNTNVATVDQNGKVTAKSVGTANIKATTTDGTNLSASCIVAVKGITEITLNKTTTSIFAGGSETLIATIAPSNVINKTLTWSSSNTNVATVDQNGKVSAKLVGNATITATATDGSGASATCQVTVKGITGISLNKTTTSIFAGGSETLIATIAPSNVINKTLTWSSSNTNVATVDQNGKVTAKLVGYATITATATDGSGASATCQVTVKGITGILLNKTTTSIFVGGTETLIATITPSNVINKALTWSSSNTNVATVNQNGKITAKAAGNATITATAEDGSGVSASCHVYVTIPVSSITLSQASVSINKGNTYTIYATVLPSNATNKTLTWTSSNTSIATVDQNGKVTAKSAGTATITATATDGSNANASCLVTITIPVNSIVLSQTYVSINQGETLTLSTTVYPANATNKSIEWSSSNTSIATVDQNGKVTAKSAGTATITATAADGSGITASCQVSVTIPVSSIILSQTSVNIHQGKAFTISPTVYPANATNKSIEWSSSNTSIATVDQNGKVTAKSAGTATITATATDGSGITASCLVTVIIPVSSINLNQTTASIYQNSTITLSPTVLPTNATNKTLNWQSSNTYIATVDQNGLVTARNIGRATITATTTDETNLSASCEVTVVPEYELKMSPNLAHVRGDDDCSYDLAISMNNRNAISGLQFVMTLPSSLEPMIDENGEYEVWLDDNRKARNHIISLEPNYNNSYLLLISSPTNQLFKGNSGDILHMRVKINNKYHSEIGDYYLTLNNIIMAEADETQHNASSSQSKLRLSYLVGDANADARVDVTDYVVTANYILGRNTGPRFFIDAANAAFSDNSINVTDLVAITNIALEIREKEYRPDINGFQLSPVEIISGPYYTVNAKVTEKNANQTVVTIAVDNDEPLAAMQFDLELPDGITLVGADITERSNDLSATYGVSTDGMARVILSTFSDNDIATGSGDVVKLTLQGNTYKGDLLRLSDIVMAERNLIEHGATGELSLDLNTVTGVNDVTYDYINIYGRDGAVIIESPVEGKAQLICVNGIFQTVTVQPGRNVYPMNVNYGDIIIVNFNGSTAKLQF